MSNPLRIAFVVEGPTDLVILKTVVGRLLEGRDFVVQSLQPEISEAFKAVPGLNVGWPGVCRWCFQAADQGGGKLTDNPLFVVYDLIIFQLDADVAETNDIRNQLALTYEGDPDNLDKKLSTERDINEIFRRAKGFSIYGQSCRRKNEQRQRF